MKSIISKILFGVCFIAIVCCSKDPVANFTFDKNNVYPPVEITFTNQSADAESYSWDFGDGSVSTEENPVHLYTDFGIMNVTLTAKNGNSSQAITKIINLLTPPTTYSIENATSTIVLTGIFSAEYNNFTRVYFDIQNHGTLQPGEVTDPVTTTSKSRYVFFDATSTTLFRTLYPFSITENLSNVLGIYDTTMVTEVYLESKINSDKRSFKELKKEGAPESFDVQLSGKLNY